MVNYRHTTEVMAGFGETLGLVFMIGLTLDVCLVYIEKGHEIRINKEKRKINPRDTINILNCKSNKLLTINNNK